MTFNLSEYKRQWYMANRDRLLAEARQFRKDHKEQYNREQRDYRRSRVESSGLIRCQCGDPECNEMIPAISTDLSARKCKLGHHVKGKLSPWWKGGIAMHSNGYRLIKMPQHPRADHHGYVGEHVLVLEQKLGRSLSSDEEPHHLNGIKTDNRPENLEAFTHSEHARFHDRLRRRRSNGQFDHDNK